MRVLGVKSAHFLLALNLTTLLLAGCSSPYRHQGSVLPAFDDFGVVCVIHPGFCGRSVAGLSLSRPVHVRITDTDHAY